PDRAGRINTEPTRISFTLCPTRLRRWSLRSTARLAMFLLALSFVLAGTTVKAETISFNDLSRPRFPGHGWMRCSLLPIALDTTLVPESGSLLLIGIGLLPLGVWRRRSSE